MSENIGIHLHCKKCGHDWTYKGQSIYYATCPSCHTMVKVNQVGTEQHLEKEVSEDFRTYMHNFLSFIDTEEGQKQMAQIKEEKGVDVAQMIRELASLLP